MDRRRFLGTIGALTVVGLGSSQSTLGEALEQLGSRLPSAPGDVSDWRIGANEIAEIRRLAQIYEARANVVGGGATDDHEYESALVSVRNVQAVLHGRHPDQLEPELHTAAAWLFRAVGFMAFDTNRLTIAADLLWAAHECALYADNPSMDARVLSTRARQEAWSGDPSRAAALLHGALNLNGLTATELSMLNALHARALARMGRTQATLAAIGESDEMLMRITPDDTADRPWTSFFNIAHQQGDTGRALLDLALTPGGTVPDAVLEDAMSRHMASLSTFDVASHRRSSAFTTANLAATQLLLGAPDMASTTGHHAIGLAAGVRSRRMDEHLRMLRTVCADHCAGNSAADEMQEAIGLALVQSNAA